MSRSAGWADQIRAIDARLSANWDTDDGADAGGLEQARHPAYKIEPSVQVEPEVADPLGLAEDDGDQAAERRAMDRVQALGAARSVYALDAGSGQPDDLQLDF